MRNVTVSLPIYKFWELPKDSTYKAASELVKIFPVVPGEDHSTKFNREWKLRDYIRENKMELLDRTQRDYYEKAEFFADGELFVEGITWAPKLAQIQQLPGTPGGVVQKLPDLFTKFLK